MLFLFRRKPVMTYCQCNPNPIGNYENTVSVATVELVVHRYRCGLAHFGLPRFPNCSGCGRTRGYAGAATLGPAPA